MLAFFRQLIRPTPRPPRVESAPVSPSISLRHAIGKYVVESAIELAPEITPPFLTPTVRPTGTYHLQPVGESLRQPALRSIAGIPAGPDAVQWEGIAQLVAEPDNPFVPNTVKVVIQEMTVGHLQPDLARLLQKAILASEEPVTVRCKLTDGFRRPDGTWADIGVLLDFDPKDLTSAEQQVDSQ